VKIWHLEYVSGQLVVGSMSIHFNEAGYRDRNREQAFILLKDIQDNE
jgi:hypothetical protein